MSVLGRIALNTALEMKMQNTQTDPSPITAKTTKVGTGLPQK